MPFTSHRRKGSATVEMTLIGIPILFVLLSTFEMARGIWTYHTMAYALKEGTRYAIVHGQDCDPAIIPANSCLVTVGQIATVIQNAAVGLDPTLFRVEMTSLADDTGAITATTGPTLSTLLTSNNNFPTGAGAAQQAPITFIAEYPFQSAIVMFWPGSKTFSFTKFALPASSQEKVQF